MHHDRSLASFHAALCVMGFWRILLKIIDVFMLLEEVMFYRSERLRAMVSLLATLGIISLVQHSMLALLLLLAVWAVLLLPLRRVEWCMLAIVIPFFFLQDAAALQAGSFTFRQQDMLRMPAYEPLLWGYWFLHIRRVLGAPDAQESAGWSSLVGLVLTALVFSVFAGHGDSLWRASLVSTAFLLLCFHSRMDLAYGAYALLLGLIVEQTGVRQGLWFYPATDWIGLPYWFATMWLSVGLLQRRFVLPVAAWLARSTTHKQQGTT